MRLSGCIVLVALVGVCAATAAAEPHGRVTQASIGAAPLGLRGADYTRLLSEKPFVTRYANGTKRLAFANAELSVYLGTSGRGVRIVTAAREYTVTGGVGPCSALSKLARTHRKLFPHAMKTPLGNGPVVYRVGKLWFTLADPSHIGSITLAAGTPSVQTLVGGAQCSPAGEEEEAGE